MTLVVDLLIADERLVDGLKTSPHNGSGTPRDDATPGNGEMANYGGTLHYQEGINPVCYRQQRSKLRICSFDRFMALRCDGCLSAENESPKKVE